MLLVTSVNPGSYETPSTSKPRSFCYGTKPPTNFENISDGFFWFRRFPLVSDVLIG